MIAPRPDASAPSSLYDSLSRPLCSPFPLAPCLVLGIYRKVYTIAPSVPRSPSQVTLSPIASSPGQGGHDGPRQHGPCSRAARRPLRHRPRTRPRPHIRRQVGTARLPACLDEGWSLTSSLTNHAFLPTATATTTAMPMATPRSDRYTMSSPSPTRPRREPSGTPRRCWRPCAGAVYGPILPLFGLYRIASPALSTPLLPHAAHISPTPNPSLPYTLPNLHSSYVVVVAAR